MTEPKRWEVPCTDAGSRPRTAVISLNEGAVTVQFPPPGTASFTSDQAAQFLFVYGSAVGAVNKQEPQ